MDPHVADPHAIVCPGDERSRELRAIAHDFSNILGAILNYASFIDEEARAGDARAAAPPDGGRADDDEAARWRAVAGDARQIATAARRGAELTERVRALATTPPPPPPPPA